MARKWGIGPLWLNAGTLGWSGLSAEERARQARELLPPLAPRYGPYPGERADCPFAGGCKASRCPARGPCKRLGQIRDEAETAYYNLPSIQPQHAELVRQCVGARLVVAFLDQRIARVGLTSERRDGAVAASDLLKERRHWVGVLRLLHAALGMAEAEAVEPPSPLLAARLAVEAEEKRRAASGARFELDEDDG